MIHQYKLNGYNIVLDIPSGSVHVVDEVAYDIIALSENKSESEIIDIIKKKHNVSDEEIKECIEDIKELADNNKLFSKDNYIDLTKNLNKNKCVIKALCLHIAHTCNLNCSYCFASQGKYQGDRALMSFETGKRALDFLVENSGTR